jgi:uncharacterized protein
MRFLIDTNILLHAVNQDSPDHAAASRFLRDHLRVRTQWCTTWPILYEFLRVSTHRRVFRVPLKARQALDFVGSLVRLDELTVLAPTQRHLETLGSICRKISAPSGNLFHDIHTATLMQEHGVPEIITADADFLQFHFMKVRNPLLSVPG